MQPTRPTFIVGIGASAGGLNAYKAFFDALSPSTGMAFVVISHILPAAHSQLAEILSRHTKMPVTLARSGLEILSNAVYVIPADADLSIENGALKVVSPRTRRNAQVNLFFSSLATAMGSRAIGIVFSGYGHVPAREHRARHQTVARARWSRPAPRAARRSETSNP